MTNKEETMNPTAFSVLLFFSSSSSPPLLRLFHFFYVVSVPNRVLVFFFISIQIREGGSKPFNKLVLAVLD